MKIIFFSQDEELRKLGERLEGVDWSFCEMADEALFELGQLNDEELACILFDFDLPEKNVIKSIDKVQKKYLKRANLVRLGVGDEDSLGLVRKHQKTKYACHSYLIKPVDAKSIEEGINQYLEVILEDDFEPITLHTKTLEELNALNDEKEDYDTTKSKIIIPKELKNSDRSVIEGAGVEDENEKEESEIFDVQEFRMDSTVKGLIEKHSMPEDGFDFSADPTNQKIQSKFDMIFKEKSAALEEEIDSFGDFDEDNDSLSFDDREESADSPIAFDLIEEDEEVEEVSQTTSDEADGEDMNKKNEMGLDFSEPDEEEVEVKESEPALSNTEVEELKFSATGEHDISEISDEDLAFGGEDEDSPVETATTNDDEEDIGFDLGSDEEDALLSTSDDDGLSFDLADDDGIDLGDDDGAEVLTSPADEGGLDLSDDDLDLSDNLVESQGGEQTSTGSISDEFDGLDLSEGIEEENLDQTVVSSVDTQSFTGAGGDSTSDRLEQTISEIVQGPAGGDEGEDSLTEEFDFNDESLVADSEKKSDEDATAQTVVASTLSDIIAKDQTQEAPEEDNNDDFDLAGLIDEDESDNYSVEEGNDDQTMVASLDEISAPPVEEPPAPAQASSPSVGKSSPQEESVARPMSSYNNDELLRLQATIKQLREDREVHLGQIQELKNEIKLTEHDHLGIRAELDEARIEITILKKRHVQEVEELKYQLGLAEEKKQIYEERCKNYQKEFDRLNQKVRLEFNSVKQREKELESQLELITMDTEAQVQARDTKILELKRKIDALEFNMENATIREEKSRSDRIKVEERMAKIMATLRGSIKLLENDFDLDEDLKTRLNEDQDDT